MVVAGQLEYDVASRELVAREEPSTALSAAARALFARIAHEPGARVNARELGALAAGHRRGMASIRRTLRTQGFTRRPARGAFVWGHLFLNLAGFAGMGWMAVGFRFAGAASPLFFLFFALAGVANVRLQQACSTTTSAGKARLAQLRTTLAKTENPAFPEIPPSD